MPTHHGKGATRYSTIDNELAKFVGCQVHCLTAKKHSRLHGQEGMAIERLFRKFYKEIQVIFQ
jgi:hypothetical protein